MWVRVALDMEKVSIDGREYQVKEGFIELPYNPERGILKYLSDMGWKQVPECEIPDRLKGANLPPAIADAHEPLNFPYYGKKGAENDE